MKCGLSVAQLDALVAGPRLPGHQFVHSGTTRDEVYSMAGQLLCLLGGENQPVCLAVNDRAVMAAALLASLAGAPSMLLPHGLSQRILTRMQRETGFATMITDGDRELATPGSVRIIHLQPTGENGFSSPKSAAVDSELLRIFTGGSTGSPQIWSKTCTNIFSEALFLARHFDITEKDCVVATVPPYHIYGLLFSVVLPLVSGARVVAATPSFPGDIAAAIREHEATVFAAVPAHYRVLRQQALSDSNLRLAVSSAGMLEEEDSLAFFHNNGVGVVEVYGSTETGGIATRNRARGEEHFTALPTVDWKIHREQLAVVSPYISPDLELLPDGYFLTADRVEACGNGFLLKGRADNITKVGGKRVDLEEIRTLIKNAPGVTDAVVLALPDAGGRGVFLASLIQGQGVDVRDVKTFLSLSLEAYAMPRIVKTIPRIPLQENGKYDRKAIAGLLSA
jgi:acyl-coenzyme A synthetase/AMP-(fatty) acid ligase